MPDPLAIWPADAEPAWFGDDAKFTGRTCIQQVASALGASTMNINYLTFEAGARCRPHRHDADQVLFFIEGPGIIAIDGGPDELVDAGQFVLLQANVVHMHGASADRAAVHVSLMPPVHTTEWDVNVPETWRRFTTSAP